MRKLWTIVVALTLAGSPARAELAMPYKKAPPAPKPPDKPADKQADKPCECKDAKK